MIRGRATPTDGHFGIRCPSPAAPRASAGHGVRLRAAQRRRPGRDDCPRLLPGVSSHPPQRTKLRPSLAHWWSMISFRKPVSTPDQVRGRLFRDHARVLSAVVTGVILALAPGAIGARCASVPGGAPCPGNADALGTARILAVDAATTPRVGRKQFPGTLPLAPKEVVLTFDDGPSAAPTTRVLDALKHECVQAAFFLLGRNAQAHPELARRELAEGHTV